MRVAAMPPRYVRVSAGALPDAAADAVDTADVGNGVA